VGVFINQTLQFIPTAEGRFLPNNTATTTQQTLAVNGGVIANSLAPRLLTGSYEYQLSDHLGNLRVACQCSATTGETVLTQENHYDPWGVNLSDIELVSEKTSDWWQFNAQSEKNFYPDGSYDYETDFRPYDEVLGRFRSVDPMSHTLTGISGYQFGYNNPVSFNDPHGDIPIALITAGIGAIAGGIAGYNIARSNGASQNQAAGAAFGGAILGAAIGYGLGSINYGGIFGGVEKGATIASNSLRPNPSMFLASIGKTILQDAEFTSPIIRPKVFPAFSTLWTNYPHDLNGEHQHPSSDSYAKNQCAIRVGSCLMLSGVKMNSYPLSNKTSEGYPRSSKGLADWLWKEYGKPEIISQPDFQSKHWNKTGIMYIAPPVGGIGHIDLFNKGATGSGYYAGSEIWFWNIK
jgi:RHS repeat-associated protein